MLMSTTYHIYKYPFQMNCRPKCERQSTKSPEDYIGKCVPDLRSGKDNFQRDTKSTMYKGKD